MRLRDVLPKEAFSCEFKDSAFLKYLDREVREVVTEYDPRFPFKHKHVHVWWILEGGIAVAWNENPSLGWSFPVAKIREVG